jgi:hypothetical protein
MIAYDGLDKKAKHTYLDDLADTFWLGRGHNDSETFFDMGLPNKQSSYISIVRLILRPGHAVGMSRA